MGIDDFGQMHRLAKIARPETAVITNIGWCHLENLKTRDGILQAKTEIFDHLRENGHIIINGDDDKLSTVGTASLSSETGNFCSAAQALPVRRSRAAWSKPACELQKALLIR